MTDEEMEIENGRYTGKAFVVLPLASGRIAVLLPNRDKYKTVDTWAQALVVGATAQQAMLDARPKRETHVSFDLEDIDFLKGLE